MIHVVSPKWIGQDCLNGVRQLDAGSMTWWRYRHPSGVFGVPFLTVKWRSPRYITLNIGPHVPLALQAAKAA